MMAMRAEDYSQYRRVKDNDRKIFDELNVVSIEMLLRSSIRQPSVITSLSMREDSSSDELSLWNSVFGLENLSLSFGTKCLLKYEQKFFEANWTIFPQYEEIIRGVSIRSVLIDKRWPSRVVSTFCDKSFEPIDILIPDQLTMYYDANFQKTVPDQYARDFPSRGLYSAFMYKAILRSSREDLSERQTERVENTISLIMGHTFCSRVKMIMENSRPNFETIH